jgi:hypothetical protein
MREQPLTDNQLIRCEEWAKETAAKPSGEYSFIGMSFEEMQYLKYRTRYLKLDKQNNEG